MLFSSVDFAIFLPVVFFVYWTVPRAQLGVRNVVLLVASYLFYGWWDYRFLSLIVGSSLLDYFVGRGLASMSDPRHRRLLLTLSVGANLALLGFFKYFNFFVESLSEAFTLFGMPLELRALDVVLPVGISFYTFQTMSYSIDVYRGRISAARELVPFLAYVAFFPQLVAGPIERATNLLPQFLAPRDFDEGKAIDGLRQMLWGFFKKVVIADNCAPLVDDIFSAPGNYSGSTLLLGAVLFAFQIYGDFSGYSDIAVGTARLFGFELMQNFAFPYFSRDIAEFWRRWHISLSTWFRDYLYIPLGGSRCGRGQQVRNTFIIFLVSGFWHGANWTFVVWGALHAVYFLPLLLAGNNRRHLAPIALTGRLPGLSETARMLGTFSIVVVAWVFFRAESVTAALHYLAAMLSPSLLSVPEILPTMVFLFIGVMLTVEWLNREQTHGLAISGRDLPVPVRWAGYLGLTYCVLFFGAGAQAFIYFQF